MTATNAPTEAAPTPKRLYRDVEHGILGGVCAGIAEYLNIDITIVRVLWVLLVFAAGTGVLAYLVLWLVVPVKPAPPAPAAVRA